MCTQTCLRKQKAADQLVVARLLRLCSRLPSPVHAGGRDGQIVASNIAQIHLRLHQPKIGRIPIGHLCQQMLCCSQHMWMAFDDLQAGGGDDAVVDGVLRATAGMADAKEARVMSAKM